MGSSLLRLIFGDGTVPAPPWKLDIASMQSIGKTPVNNESVNPFWNLEGVGICGARGYGQKLPGDRGFRQRNPVAFFDAAPLKAGRPKARLPVVPSKRKRNEAH
jgi:hypothetical protein